MFCFDYMFVAIQDKCPSTYAFSDLILFRLARTGTCPCKVKEHTPGQVISLLKGRDRQHAFVSPKKEKIQSDIADVKVNHIVAVFVVSKFSFQLRLVTVLPLFCILYIM